MKKLTDTIVSTDYPTIGQKLLTELADAKKKGKKTSKVPSDGEEDEEDAKLETMKKVKSGGGGPGARKGKGK